VHGPNPAAAKQPHLQQSKKSKVFWREEHTLDTALSYVLLIFGKQECLWFCRNWEARQMLAGFWEVIAAGSPPFMGIPGTHLVTEAHSAKTH